MGSMFVAFFESLKYVGHLYPIAFLRIFMGYYFLNMAMARLGGEFLRQPRLAAVIMDNLPESHLPTWYANFLQYVVVPNWQFFSYFITYCEFVIGISFLIGFLVRPTAILGSLLMLNFIFAGGDIATSLQQTFLALFIVLFWVGAGRCLGFDYFFYKRQRGLWW
jgi:thiosulfate dehydrogenase [quinone] large subunit